MPPKKFSKSTALRFIDDEALAGDESEEDDVEEGGDIVGTCTGTCIFKLPRPYSRLLALVLALARRARSQRQIVRFILKISRSSFEGEKKDDRLTVSTFTSPAN